MSASGEDQRARDFLQRHVVDGDARLHPRTDAASDQKHGPLQVLLAGGEAASHSQAHLTQPRAIHIERRGNLAIRTWLRTHKLNSDQTSTDGNAPLKPEPVISAKLLPGFLCLRKL